MKMMKKEERREKGDHLKKVLKEKNQIQKMKMKEMKEVTIIVEKEEEMKEMGL